MGVSHISNVESLILYLYFQIIILTKNVCERFPSYCGPEIDVSVWKINKIN